jgi:hypothetical protein
MPEAGTIVGSAGVGKFSGGIAGAHQRVRIFFRTAIDL